MSLTVLRTNCWTQRQIDRRKVVDNYRLVNFISLQTRNVFV
jgi:hypothetical protein